MGGIFLDFWEESNSDGSLRLKLDNGNTFIGGIDFEISDDKFPGEIILIVEKAIEKNYDKFYNFIKNNKDFIAVRLEDTLETFYWGGKEGHE